MCCCLVCIARGVVLCIAVECRSSIGVQRTLDASPPTFTALAIPDPTANDRRPGQLQSQWFLSTCCQILRYLWYLYDITYILIAYIYMGSTKVPPYTLSIHISIIWNIYIYINVIIHNVHRIELDCKNQCMPLLKFGRIVVTFALNEAGTTYCLDLSATSSLQSWHWKFAPRPCYSQRLWRNGQWYDHQSYPQCTLVCNAWWKFKCFKYFDHLPAGKPSRAFGANLWSLSVWHASCLIAITS